MDERDTRLAHRLVDGEASEAERAELRERCARDGELDAFVRKLEAATRHLDEVADLDPPPRLGRDVLGTLPEIAEHRQLETQRMRVRAWSGPPLPWTHFATRYAVGFAIGLMVTAAAYEFSTGGPEEADASMVAGSMIAAQDRPQVATTTELQVDGLAGELSLYRRQGLLVLDMDILSREGVEIYLPLASEHSIAGFVQMSGAAPRVRLDPPGLELVPAGAGRFAVLLRTGPLAIPVELRRGGRLIHAEEIRVPEASEP